MRVLLVSANREQYPSPVVPLGVLTVAGALRDAHEVRVVDLCFEADPARALQEAAAAFAPEVIGFGIRNLHTNSYDGMERLVDEYRGAVAALRAASAAPIVLGGSGYSLQPERLLAALDADHGVVGEGERSFRALVDALARGERPPRITAASPPPPVIVLRGAQGAGGDPEAHSDLDLLPAPARDLVDPRYYELDGTDNIQTKRGCAFHCEYCDYPDLEGRKIRLRDPEAIADEVLARSRAPGVSHIFFVDSVWNVPRSHALAICRALMDRGNPLPWVCYGSPASFDDELVSAMARARCLGVEIGSDTGTERMLERLRKPFTIGQIERTRELFVEHGILDAHTFVLGALDETPDEVRETLDFVDRLAPDVAVFIAFMEDRESSTVHRARYRDEILRLLSVEAPKRPGWIVPELGIRFGPRVSEYVRRAKLRGPAWLHLAQARRRAYLAARGRGHAEVAMTTP
ncbi:MAG: cobalamin-dependent protein [Polyangiaceae bacterium]|nr:cobalamin-dependent protein [Polyangiaceae bacterium]